MNPGAPPVVRSKARAAYDTLKERILEGRLRIGERLVIDEISAELGISAIPVREALRQLEADGFLDIRPYAGATVSDVRAAEIVEIFELLEALETISARLACSRATESAIQDLSAMVRAMDDLVTAPERWSRANVEFHRAMCDRADCRLVGLLMERVMDHWVRLRSQYLRNIRPQLEERQREHHLLIAAVARRDDVAVVEIVRAHNRRALDEHVGYLRVHPNVVWTEDDRPI